MTEIQQKLIETKEKISNLELIESEYLDAKSRRNDLNSKLAGLLHELDSKNKEITKLEKFSVGGAIKSLFVDKKKQLESKRDEYYKLSKEYDKLKSEISALDYEMELLGKKYQELLLLKEEYEALKEQREKELAAENSTQGIAYRNILEDIENENNHLLRINGAFSLIDKLINKLTLFSASLREIQGYGHWKNRRRMRRSGSYKSIAIKNAKQYYLESTLLLRKLEQFLEDLNFDYFDIKLKNIEFDSLLNIFFDNFITDIILSKKINEAVNNVDEVYNKLNVLKNELNDKENEIKQKIQKLEKLQDELIS